MALVRLTEIRTISILKKEFITQENIKLMAMIITSMKME